MSEFKSRFGAFARAGMAAIVFMAIVAPVAKAQTLTLGGGETIRAGTKHDYARLELNIPWRPEIWHNEKWTVGLTHAVSVAGFHDENNVYLASWVPNFTLTPASKSGYYPFLQVGVGIALLSDKEFQSEDFGNGDDGTSNMGSYFQFQSSIALGIVRDRFSVHGKVYHISNAELASENDGMDIAEFGVSYSF